MHSSHSEAEIRTKDCSTFVRRVAGPEALELFVVCRPECGSAAASRQAEAVYQAILELLASEGASFEAITAETLFLRSIREDLNAVLDARKRVLDAGDSRQSERPVTTSIEQPPLREEARLELSVLAVIPRLRAPGVVFDVWGTPTCGCDACSRSYARVVRLGDQSYLHSGNLYGAGEGAYEEACGLFRAAEDMLGEGGMTFREVIRTWIYLRDIDRDYDDFNRARRDFFRSKGIEVSPASTGIGGTPLPDGHDFSISLYAIKSPRPLEAKAMSARTLNEPSAYGSDFSRGLKVVEANKVALYVSGTASVDELGRTAHVGDFEAQADRMLTNVSCLLGGQGASVGDLVSAVTYLKDPSDAERMRAIFQERGWANVPNVLVEAPICRPELLCETEAVAVLPLRDGTGGAR